MIIEVTVKCDNCLSYNYVDLDVIDPNDSEAIAHMPIDEPCVYCGCFL